MCQNLSAVGFFHVLERYLLPCLFHEIGMISDRHLDFHKRTLHTDMEVGLLYVRACVCVGMCASVCVSMHMYACVCDRVRMCASVRACAHVCVRVRACVWSISTGSVQRGI